MCTADVIRRGEAHRVAAAAPIDSLKLRLPLIEALKFHYDKQCSVIGKQCRPGTRMYTADYYMSSN